MNEQELMDTQPIVTEDTQPTSNEIPVEEEVADEENLIDTSDKAELVELSTIGDIFWDKNPKQQPAQTLQQKLAQEEPPRDLDAETQEITQQSIAINERLLEDSSPEELRILKSKNIQSLAKKLLNIIQTKQGKIENWNIALPRRNYEYTAVTEKDGQALFVLQTYGRDNKTLVERVVSLDWGKNVECTVADTNDQTSPFYPTMMSDDLDTFLAQIFPRPR